MKKLPPKRTGAEKILYALLAGIVLTVCALEADAQNAETQKLNARVAELYQKGEVDAAIPIAEEIVKIERKGSSKRNLANALENLGQMKMDRYKRAAVELRSPALKPDRAGSLIARLRDDARESEEHFREAMKLADTDGTAPTGQKAGIRNNLAWLLYNYIPPDTHRSLGFDKDSRDKFEMRNRAAFLKRTGEAKELYSEAVAIAESDKESDAAAAALFNLAEFEIAMGELESAIGRYEKIIAAVEVKYGKRTMDLMPPLESYAKALAATNQDDQVFEAISRLVRVTGKSAKYPKTLLNLTPRADRAFAPLNAPSVLDDTRANKERAELAGRRAVVSTAATGGDVTGISLGTSTLGREFYETANSRGIRIRKVAVRVFVDENGKVVEAEGLTTDKDLKEAAEKAVKTWSFRPAAIDGRQLKMKGYVECMFLSN